MNKIYLITSGDYSDYHIDAVFSSKEKADEFMALAKQNDDMSTGNFVRSDYRVEVHELDTINLKESNCWEAHISGATGEVISQRWSLSSQIETHQSNHDIIGYGRSPEHARRSAEEFRRVLITTPANWQIDIKYYGHNGNHIAGTEKFTDTLLAFQRCEELVKLQEETYNYKHPLFRHIYFFLHKLQ